MTDAIAANSGSRELKIDLATPTQVQSNSKANMKIESISDSFGPANSAEISGALHRIRGVLSTDEVDLDQISAGHLIRIETLNSTYTFVVTDAVRTLGVLKGGVVGEQEAIAVLLNKADATSSRRNQRLKRGSRAVFIIRRGDSTTRVITSRITRLASTKP
jgi:hypothetical protein